jgi:hypothetical protein
MLTYRDNLIITIFSESYLYSYIDDMITLQCDVYHFATLPVWNASSCEVGRQKQLKPKGEPQTLRL